MTIAKRAASWLEKLSVGLLLLGVAGGGIWQGRTIEATVCLVCGLCWAWVCFRLTRRIAGISGG